MQHNNLTYMHYEMTILVSITHPSKEHPSFHTDSKNKEIEKVFFSSGDGELPEFILLTILIYNL